MNDIEKMQRDLTMQQEAIGDMYGFLRYWITNRWPKENFRIIKRPVLTDNELNQEPCVYYRFVLQARVKYFWMTRWAAWGITSNPELAKEWIKHFGCPVLSFATFEETDIEERDD